MSSTKSPISSGPTNAGTHNSSTAQRSWRRSLYFWMIQAWQVGEIEIQCRLARFVISKRVGMEVILWWIKMEFERQYDEFEGKRGAPPGRRRAWCRVRWSRGVLMVMQNEIEGRKSRPRSADGDWGAPMQRSSPSMLSRDERKGGKKSVMT